MKLSEDDLPGLVQELRSVFGSLKGFKGLTETISLSFVVLVENEEAKEGVINVGNLLTQQAAQRGIDIEVVPATQEELDEAAELYKQHQAAKNGSFVL